jgi:hypothetical protein
VVYIHSELLDIKKKEIMLFAQPAKQNEWDIKRQISCFLLYAESWWGEKKVDDLKVESVLLRRGSGTSVVL